MSPLSEETVIEKHFPNSFLQTELITVLQESDITDLVICGAMSHMCIDTTVRAAKELGFKCILIADACATRNLKFGSDIFLHKLSIQYSWQHLTACLQLL